MSITSSAALTVPEGKSGLLALTRIATTLIIALITFFHQGILAKFEFGFGLVGPVEPPFMIVSTNFINELLSPLNTSSLVAPLEQ